MGTGYELIHSGIQIILNHWYEQVLFSWKWWLVVSFSTLPWMIILYWINKERRNQYIISGLILMITSSFLDISGLSYDLWRYYVTALPMMGGFFPWNFSIIPFFFILSFEIFPKWSPLSKGVTVSLMFAFIGEPMMDYLGLTVHDKWKHLYSVPIYYVLYLVSFYGGLILSKNGKATFHNSNHDIDKHEEKLSNDMYHYAFEHSFNSIYVIEKKNQDKDFRFTQVNDHFCNELGYTKEEMLSLDPRLISDQKSYNVDIKYRPLLLKGNMEIDTVLLKKSGEKKYVNLKVKVFRRKDKIEILSIANFLENKVTDFEAN